VCERNEGDRRFLARVLDLMKSDGVDVGNGSSGGRRVNQVLEIR
jgi:hypothetical protein